jgi:hypothetical protein
MQRQGLSGGLPGIESAVSAMGGAHAQMMSAAELSIGIRVEQVVTADVRSSLRQGGPLVKTYGPRGTVHLLLRAELPLWCAALGSAPANSSLPPDVRLSVAQVAETVDAIGASLATSSPLDADELGAAVVARLGPWAAEPVVPAFGGWWPRWRQAIAIAAYRGVLAFGDNRGSRVTYVNPHVDVEPDPRRALGWLLRRFLTTYGPATPEHFGRWLGVRKTWASEQFAFHSSEVEPVTVAGELAYVVAGDTAMPAGPIRGATLLPHFDPYVIGSFPRELLFPGAAAARALGRGQAGVHPVLLVDGVVAGVWSSQRAGSLLTITVEPVTPFSKSIRSEIVAAAQRIGEFLEVETALAIGTVTTGAHK